MIMMRKFLPCYAVLLLSIALFAQTSAKTPAAAPAPAPAAANALPPGAPNLELCDAYFKRMFGYDPNIQVKVLSIGVSSISGMFDVTGMFVTPEGQQVVHWYVSKDLKHAIAGDILPFGADPFVTERTTLSSAAFGPTKGPVDAKLLIVEFADLECPACREAAPLMERLRNDFPQARFIFQSFPLAALHPWALRASLYLDCIARSTPDHAFTFIDAVYSHQKEIESDVRKTDASGKVTIDDAAVTERLRHFTDWAGADMDKTQACAENPATAERLNKSLQLGQSIGVTGTPTIFINGRRIGNPSPGQYEALKTVVAYEAQQAAAGK
jgi:protein-disulfide isomerase